MREAEALAQFPGPPPRPTLGQNHEEDSAGVTPLNSEKRQRVSK
jgi:hypothetical protein